MGSKSVSSEIVLELIRLITKPAFKRTEREIELVLPWLRKRSQLLQNQEQNVLVDLVKNCSLLSTTADDVIIKQGERGDSYYEDFCFYIVLRGTVSVYIDPKMTGEASVDESSAKASAKKRVKRAPPTAAKSEDSVLSGMEQSVDEEATSQIGVPTEVSQISAEGNGDEEGTAIKPKSRNLVPLNRDKLGKMICSYGSGKAFGELALVNHDTLRNASVVANEDVDLMVIDQDLFDRSLRAEQEAKYEEIRQFIEGHPFFQQMNTKFKKLLEMSLRKEHYIFDTHIFKQGEPVIGLHFIISGAANVIIQPKKHQQQYIHMWPFEAGMDQLSIEFEHLREARRQAILRKYEDPSVWETKPEELVIRREQGYAAIEKKMKENHINLCSVQDREVFGDVEMLVGLSTYMQTVRCTANTTCFVLDTKNFERLVSKKNNPHTMDVMREYVKAKLHTRMNMRNADLIPLLGFLHQKLTEQSIPPAKKVEPFKTSKALPDVDEEVQHLLQYFREGKEVVLIKPSVPGVVYYRELMREKAKTREAQRKSTKTGGEIKLGSVYKSRQRRQPRSMLQIRESLRQMMEAEVIELETKKERKKKRKRKRESVHESNPQSNYVSAESTPRTAVSGMPQESRADMNAKTSLLAQLKASSNNGTDTVDSSRVKNGDTKSGLPPVFVTEVTQTKAESALPAIREELTQEEISLRSPHSPITAVQIDNEQARNVTSAEALQDKSNKLDANSANDKTTHAHKGVTNAHKDQSFPSGMDEHEIPTLITPKRGTGNKKNDSIPPSSDNVPRLPEIVPPTQMKSVGGEVMKTDRTDNSDKSNGWQAAMTFVNKRIQERLSVRKFELDPVYRDYETSEPSLHLLENRIQAFHVQYGMGNKTKNLPHLKRYKLDEETVNEKPKPGGKVWVKKQLCKFSNTEYRVKDHQHVRYQMVETIPEYEKVQKSKAVMQYLMKATTENK